jgi:hypothetical protein
MSGCEERRKERSQKKECNPLAGTVWRIDRGRKR